MSAILTSRILQRQRCTRMNEQSFLYISQLLSLDNCTFLPTQYLPVTQIHLIADNHDTVFLLHIIHDEAQHSSVSGDIRPYSHSWHSYTNMIPTVLVSLIIKLRYVTVYILLHGRTELHLYTNPNHHSLPSQTTDWKSVEMQEDKNSNNFTNPGLMFSTLSLASRKGSPHVLTNVLLLLPTSLPLNCFHLSAKQTLLWFTPVFSYSLSNVHIQVRNIQV